MDAEQKWKEITHYSETLRLQMAGKVRQIDALKEELQSIIRQLQRVKPQEENAWEAYQQSLQERGL